MDWNEGQELRRLEEKMNGVCIAMESGFSGLRKDIGYLGRLYIPLTALTVLAVLALAIALENRALLLSRMPAAISAPAPAQADVPAHGP